MFGGTFDVDGSLISHLINFSSSEINCINIILYIYRIHFNKCYNYIMETKMPGGNGHLSDNLLLN